ncbi:MAG: pyruvate dehydrogenase (acetyl-transferring) E1 component subunit alpha [Chloroflexi bacterium]|nr:pyruvate dehydrogenase (acetyl-transferring) E1 component subunit alpha [Chloroflexota bacterium]
MLLIRRFEERTGEMYTKGKVRGFLHLYIGEEACAVGSISALRPQDKLITHYRDHGHAIARGIAPQRIMAELFGRVDGTSKGRGGSMHIFDKQANFYGGHAIVGGHMPVAVGLGLAAKMQGQDSVTMCVFGDGGVAEGEFHESLNLSSLWKTPNIWFLENNGYGMGLPLAKSVANEIYRLAEAYRIPSVRVDGMDVVGVHEVTEKALEHCRTGEGPYFIEAMTYRYRGHSMADAELYRQKSEVEEFRKRDPIERLKARMLQEDMITDRDYDELVARVEEEVAQAIQFADASAQPGLDTLYDGIYKENANG